MRPEVLYPLFGDVQSLAGVGPKVRANMERLCGTKLVDLLWHLPLGVVDRRWRPKISALVPGRIATLRVTIGKHRPAPRRVRAPYRVEVSDETGSLALVFFRADKSWLEKKLPPGEVRIISGKVERFSGQLQMPHPDFILPEDRLDELPEIEPVYPMTAGLSPKTLVKSIRTSLDKVPVLKEWQDPHFLARQSWLTWDLALRDLHAPVSDVDFSPNAPARQRLAYDELLANQLALAIIRQQARRRKGRVIAPEGRVEAKVMGDLPFELTLAQQRTVDEISADLVSGSAMLRLVQGDVGSGKTVVAMLAMARVVESGAQAALLAPTEILANQHLKTIKSLADAAGLKTALLTGRIKGKARATILAELAAGEIDILIGTHALFQDPVEYSDLALVVVDEQHRFGVHQRLALQEKGRTAPHVLVMTATPIPRTLTLTIYGDMDVSRIDEKPPGRQPVGTRVVPISRMADVVSGLGRALDEGQQVYWVCPLIEESDMVDLAAAEDRARLLKEEFGDKVGLIHGRLKGDEKAKAMEDFAAGRINLLVATTVIEVGVDVPQATIMVIEQAERFGLAQLHQLRGRVGRGADKSHCILLRGDTVSETARRRLAIMRETDDGFLIAEEDLKLRGAGELLGTRQSGMPQFRVADLAEHGELLAIASDDARLIVNQDPGLTSARGEALRTLLYLFERDKAVALLSSG